MALGAAAAVDGKANEPIVPAHESSEGVPTSILQIRDQFMIFGSLLGWRGRVFSIQSLDRGFTLLGGAMGGFTIALIGGPFAVAVFGVLMVVGTIGVGAKASALRKFD